MGGCGLVEPTISRPNQASMPRLQFPDSDEGVEFVRCRICGDKRRVISGRHLSKHEIDRDAYMREFGLTPDALVAKDFCQFKSSRGTAHPTAIESRASR